MKKKKSIRATFLLWIAILNCIVILVILISLGSLLIRDGIQDRAVPLTALFFLPFLFHAGFIVHILKQYYPATDLTRSYRIFFKIVVGIVMLILVVVLIGLTDLAISFNEIRPFVETMNNPINISILITFSFLLVTQFYMLFEGYWLLKAIRRNFRTSLLDNMQL